uniref:Calcium load-activated calcium channel n=1 Tax=Timspurckia oligopyrenoides TaxID=708627 RepID=A0A7S0ZBL7_9RHOD|mmetsp:Transcript_11492/g.20773  ORF Transcript_11492/g.20773 Transcript_11492/m.20773 type:complete len:190 (+) Transcript_11492:55-624(+)
MDLTAVYILGLVVLMTFSVEGLSWYVLYRTDEYKRNSLRIKELNVNLEKEKSTLVALDKRKAHEKKVARLEEDLKAATAELSRSKFKLNIFVSMCYMVMYYYLNNYVFNNSGPIGKVPFEPMFMAKSFVHRGIQSEDVKEIGFAFMYAISSMSVKANIQKALGFSPPRSNFDAWEDQKKNTEKYMEKYS